VPYIRGHIPELNQKKDPKKQEEERKKGPFIRHSSWVQQLDRQSFEDNL
jgi:hypothetical protein